MPGAKQVDTFIKLTSNPENMNFNLNISGESANELVETLQAFASASVGQTKKPDLTSLDEGFTTKPEPTKESSDEQPIAPVKATRKAAPKTEEPKVETPKGPAKAETITIETVRAEVQLKAVAGKRDELKSLLKEFGVERVTDLAEADYSEFINKVKEL